MTTCNCDAYPFPHREGGGDCNMPDWCGVHSRSWEDCAIEGVCEYHQYIDREYHYDPREEALTAAERNAGATWMK